jgi:hypothetical protein
VDKVLACHARYRQPGLLKVKITIRSDGSVSSATALEPYTRTPMGTCAEKAVLGATFKASDGGIAVTYPFSLR